MAKDSQSLAILNSDSQLCQVVDAMSKCSHASSNKVRDRGNVKFLEFSKLMIENSKHTRTAIVERNYSWISEVCFVMLCPRSPL